MSSIGFLECHDPCAAGSLADVAVSSVPSSFNPALSGCSRSDDGGALSLLGGGALFGGAESEVGAPLLDGAGLLGGEALLDGGGGEGGSPLLCEDGGPSGDESGLLPGGAAVLKAVARSPQALTAFGTV
jgi:hypothetical protein